MSAWADPFAADRVADAAGLLGAFNDAGVLHAADVHVARRLGALAGEDDEAVLLAAALAVRGPRLGHVFCDLATAATQTTVETEEPVDLTVLPWPEPTAWVAAVAASPLTGADRPLALEGTRLYLDRYRAEELRIAADLGAFGVADVDRDVLRAGLARLFPDAVPGDRQVLAASTAVLRRLAVVAGGPGTGKTTTVARILALLLDQARAAGGPAPLVALAAPTGKAAARLQEAVHAQARELDVDPADRDALLATTASTLHRLLGSQPGSRSRFRHHRGNRLPHDVVLVDETSMVSLSLMARLVEAVRPDARLVLVGDPGQLTSVEAGAVLGDVVGPARDGLVLSAAAAGALTDVTGAPVAATGAAVADAIGDGIVVLDRTHRFDSRIAALATAIAAGDGDATVAALRAGAPDITWVDADAATTTALPVVRAAAVTAARGVLEAARAGDGAGALAALGSFRLLCAHRRGPAGAAAWRATVERWLAQDLDDLDPLRPWYVGRPLLVTENDHALKLYNGDTGVVVSAEEGRVSAVFERRGEPVAFSPTRLSAVETVHAMTIHKSQGSQFTTAAVLLPGEASALLTRELLYTGVTRASDHLIVVGTEAVLRAAVSRPAARASGLRDRLWPST